MRSTKNYFAIIISLLFFSCQKELNNTDPATPASGSKVKTYIEDIHSASTDTVTTFNLAYDNNDREISMTSAVNSGDRFEFQYSTGSFIMDLYNHNVLNIHEVFYITNNSFIDSSFQYNDTQDSMTEKYIYNSAKQLITLKEYEYSTATGAVLFNTTHILYDSNGNPINATDDNSVTTYEYYPDLLNNLVFGIPYSPISKSLVKTTTYNESGTSSVFNHVYTFDASNRISTEKITSDDGEVLIKSYTYY